MELVVGGRRVYAATGGKPFDPALPGVVFIHGSGMDHTVWAMQTRYFAHHGRSVLAIDLPGHGRSEGPLLETIEDMAAFVVDAVTAAGATQPQSVALVGHSLGALTALEAAARLGERSRGLALLGMTPLMPVHPDLLALADHGARATIDIMVTWAVGRQAQIGGNEASGLWTTQASMSLLERADPRSIALDLAACNAYRGAAEAAARLSCPVLLVIGAEDRMTPAPKAVEFARAIGPSAKAVTLAGAGHMMMIEQPTATLAALKAVL
ncbi:MAG TPA: alpha/beta hydrolase [Stellaceae bacterium]|jgi:pimeloyl-ACP methyl ester carboxylesterase